MNKTLLMLIIMGVTGYGILNYHFILFDKTLKILKKDGVRYEDTFVDARGIKKLELTAKPHLIAAGYNDLVKELDKSVKENSSQ